MPLSFSLRPSLVHTSSAERAPLLRPMARPSVLKRSGYNSIGSSRRWLNGARNHERNAEALKAMRIILLSCLSFLALYTVVVLALGYTPPADNANDPPEVKEFHSKSWKYFLASGVVSLSVMGLTVLGIMRESPTISMLCSILMLVIVAQSLSNTLYNSSFHVLAYLFLSPAAIMCLIGVLLAVYTSLIWSSEFETPPCVIEEYKWYLNRIRSKTGEDLDQGLFTLDLLDASTAAPGASVSETASRDHVSVSAAGSVSASQTGLNRRSILVDPDDDDDLASVSYYSSKSST